MPAQTAAWQPMCSLASGAHPASTFPNSHLLAPVAAAALGRVATPRPGPVNSANWAAPLRTSALQKLREAVREEDWERNYEEGLTKINMRPEWSANEERCNILQWLVTSNQAKRVLEIGSFCGVGALALAEALPADGEVVVVELDPFVVKFGQKFHQESLAGHKIDRNVGTAQASLEDMARQAKAGLMRPFDLVIVDADKEGMRRYFDLLWNSPGLLAPGAVVCVDMTPFKGQPPLRYLKYGFPHRWQVASGQEEIDALRATVQESKEFTSYEFGRLLVVQRAAAP